MKCTYMKCTYNTQCISYKCISCVSRTCKLNNEENLKEGKNQMMENQTLPIDFNVVSYKLLNQEMRSFSNVDAERHYDTPPPNDFDVSMYKILNVDLRYMSDTDAQIQHVFHGYKEKRVYRDMNILI